MPQAAEVSWGLQEGLQAGPLAIAAARPEQDFVKVHPSLASLAPITMAEQVTPAGLLQVSWELLRYHRHHHH